MKPSTSRLVREPIAPYVRVKAHLKTELEDGTWRPGERMPSEAHWTKYFGVSRMTVHRAMRELQAEGLIDRVQGVGTFAAELQRVSSTLTIRDIHEEIVARGHTHRAHVHVLRAERATVSVAQRLRVATGSSVFHSIIVHFENARALQCEDRYVNPACAPEYLSVDFTAVTPTHYLLQVAPLREANFAVEAGFATAREARFLGIGTQDPCLIVNRRTENRSGVITCARLTHPADHYQIVGAYKP